MVDSELGELRRPPRPIGQRVERLARWRAQGLALGESDTPFPADDDTTLLQGGDASASESMATPQWHLDQFDLTYATTSPLTLTYIPEASSEVVSLNGIRLDPAVDYSIAGASLTLTDLASLRLGIGADTWDLVASYAYYDQATSDPAPVQTFGGLETSTVTLAAAPTDGFAVLVTSGGVTAVSGAYATWTLLFSGSPGPGGADSYMKLWVGLGPTGGTSISLTTSDNRYCAGVVFEGDYSTVTLRNSASTDLHDVLGAVSAASVAAVVGDVAIGAVLCGPDFLSGRYPDSTSLWSETGYTGTRAEVHGGAVASGAGITAGIATATSIDSTLYVTGNTTGYTQVANFSLDVA